MLKKLNNLTNVLMGSSIGVFLGNAIFVYTDYKKHADLYAMQSAPWYLSILIYGIVLIAVIIVCVIIKAVIRKKLKQ